MKKLLWIFLLAAPLGAQTLTSPPPASLGYCYYAAGDEFLPIAAGGGGSIVLTNPPPAYLVFGNYAAGPNYQPLQCDSGGNLIISGGSSALVVGTTPITSGTVGQTLYDNNGVLGSGGNAATATAIAGTATANTVYAGPASGSAAALASRALVTADLPTGIPIANVGSAGLSATTPITISSAGAISCSTCITSSGISGLTANYIPLAGSASTISGNSPLDYGVTAASTLTSSISQTGNGSAAVVFNNSWATPSADYNVPFWAQCGAQATGSFCELDLGIASSMSNRAAFDFKYVGSGSASNQLGIGFYGRTDITMIANGNVGIGTVPVVADPLLKVAGSISGTILLPYTTYSVAGTALPSCASGIAGGRAWVSDATTVIPGSTYVGGGTYTIGVECTFNSSGSVYTWIVDAGAPAAPALSSATGTATFAAGTNVTSCLAASGYPAPTNTRGDLTIVGGTATTGTICTVSFSTTLSAAPSCSVVQNGGAALFDIGWGAASTSSFTITAGLTVAASTLTVHYQCQP